DQNKCLRRRVNREVGHRLERGGRSQIDDRAGLAPEHRVQVKVREGSESRDVDLNHLQNFFARLAGKITDQAETRVVDEQVNLKPRAFGRGEDFHRGIWIGEVGFDDRDLYAMPLTQFAGEPVQPVTRTGGDDQVRAVCREPAGKGFADAVRGAGN